MPKPFKKPDKHKPRIRPYAKSVLNGDFYKRYTKEFKDSKLSVQDIRKIIHTFHELCTDVIASTRDGLELPEQLGYVFMGAYKSKESTIDTVASEKAEIKVKNWNWNSDGWICKLYYTNYSTKYHFKNHKLWGFAASRQLKQKISRAFTKNHKMYYIHTRYKRINYLYK